MNFALLPFNSVTGAPDSLNTDVLNSTDVSIAQPLSQSNKNEVNFKLPNGKPVPQYHPEWLRDTDLHITGNNTLKLTYIDEGAGYRNSIGYFVYETAKPPASLADVDLVRILIPNASGFGKGGVLVPGDTIQLPYSGTVDESGVFVADSYVFPAGTSISWVLLADGWNGRTIRRTAPIYFSNSGLNPEKTAEKRVHTVAIKADTMDDTIIYGFEDLNRDGRTDDDFNDFVFYLTPASFRDIDPEVYGGVSSLNYFGTILCNDNEIFNDQHNDCDFNDLVASYNIDIERSDYNLVTKVIIDMHFKHRGSYYDHEFGVVLDGLKGYGGNMTVKRGVFCGNAECEVVDLTDQVRDNGRLQLCDSSMVLLIPNENDNNEMFCNTSGKWYYVKVPSSSVRATLEFKDAIDIKMIQEGIIEPLVVYLKSWRSGIVGEKPEDTHFVTSLDFFTPPPMLQSSDVEKMRSIYVINGAKELRVPLEKRSLHHAYHRFTKFLQSNETAELLWWDNFRNEEIAIEYIPDVEREWPL